MNESSLARRYTRALAQTLETETELHAVKNQLQAFMQVMAADPALKTAMETFLLPLEKKKRAVDLIGQELRLDEKILRFLQVLLEENRLLLLQLVIGQMEDAWLEIHGRERITIFSVIPLAEGQRRRLREKLQILYGKEVTIDNQIDPGLLAGIKIQRGSVQYDFSLQGNLQRLKEKITEES